MSETPTRSSPPVVDCVTVALARVLPSDAATAARSVADAGRFPRREEEAALGDVALGRRREFLAGRECAHAALEAIEGHSPPIGRGPAGEPLWPAGMLGSISHTGELAAAAVARSRHAWALGLDLEALDPPLDASVARLVRAGDRSDSEPAPPELRPYLSKLVFCAKESVYKALFPVTGWALQFHDVEVAVDASAGRFRARINSRFRCAGRPLGALEGRLTIAAGHGVAALWVPRVVQAR